MEREGKKREGERKREKERESERGRDRKRKSDKRFVPVIGHLLYK